jgi:hypothetical protein
MAQESANPVRIHSQVTDLDALVKATVLDGTEPGLVVRVLPGGGAGGSGPVTIADGADTAEGTTTDAPGANTVIGKLKAIAASLAATLTADVTDRVGRLLGHVTVDNASLAVTGPLTDTQLRATPVPVSGSVAVNVITGFALEAGGNLATIAGKDFATSAKQDVQEATLVSLLGNTPALGQALMLLSQPVALASDQDTMNDRMSRRMQELRTIEAYDAALMGLRNRAYERVSLTDRRGSAGRGSSR